jgi:hypothetical protein
MQPLTDEGVLGAKAPAAPMTASETAKAKARINKMRASLKDWLRYRTVLTDLAQGKRKGKVPAQVVAKWLEQEHDWAGEKRLAIRLHAMLSEAMDSSLLPDPSKDREAAVKLARIAISGKLPGEASSPSPTGVVWFIPAAVVIAMVMYGYSAKVEAEADVQKERLKYECIKNAGWMACSGPGALVAAAAFAGLAWLAWDKFGLREAAGKLRKKAG